MILPLSLGLVCICLFIAIIADVRRIHRALRNGAPVKVRFKGVSGSYAGEASGRGGVVPVFEITFPDGAKMEKSINCNSGYFAENRDKELDGVYDREDDELVIRGIRFAYDSTIVLSIFLVVAAGLFGGALFVAVA